MKKILMVMMMFMLLGCVRTKTEYVYKNVYPELPQVESPLVLATLPCKFTMPETESNIFVGFDKENYKCYLKNQEINREQKLLYEKFVKEINKERQNWKNLNKGLDKE
jgi:hypothetical protein